MSHICYFVGFPPKVVRQKLFFADCQCYLNGTIDGSNVCETTNHFYITVSYVYLDIKKKSCDSIQLKIYFCEKSFPVAFIAYVCN